jgi:hypothetical protein
MSKETSDLFDNFADDFLRESLPRTIVIVGASKIEDLLLQILNKYLLPKKAKQKDQDELLEGDRPLATFSSRIKLIYRLGLIDNSLYDILEIIRNIRNSSAHKLSFDLKNSPLREHLLNLSTKVIKRKSFKFTKDRFFTGEFSSPYDELKCIFLTVCVLLESICENNEKIQVNIKLYKISSK